MAKSGMIEIEITEFKEDPANGCEFMIFFGISRPDRSYDLTTVYFTEEFVQQYFRIPWFKNMPEEESRIVHEKRPLFVTWALVKLEQRLRTNAPLEKIILDYDEDGIWAEKVEKGLIKPASVKQKDTLFLFDPSGNP